MNYGVLARCARTGRLGYGVASSTVAVGRACCDAVRPATGVALSLGRPANNLLGTRLLAQGFTSMQTLRAIGANDLEAGLRQTAVMDRDGVGVVDTGPSLAAWAGHRIEPDVAVFGEGLPGRCVIDAVLDSFAGDPEHDLEARLLRALEAGQSAGAPAARSAAVCVYGVQDYSDWDLRVDAHEDALAELRHVTEEFQLMAAYYIERAKNPRAAKSQMEFVDMLKANRPEAMP